MTFYIIRLISVFVNVRNIFQNSEPAGLARKNAITPNVLTDGSSAMDKLTVKMQVTRSTASPKVGYSTNPRTNFSNTSVLIIHVHVVLESLYIYVYINMYIYSISTKCNNR